MKISTGILIAGGVGLVVDALALQLATPPGVAQVVREWWGPAVGVGGLILGFERQRIMLVHVQDTMVRLERRIDSIDATIERILLRD